MIKKYLSLLIIIISIAVIYACSNDTDDDYTSISPVTVDLTLVPYTKLSDYKFFEGEMKNQIPSLDVIPYEPASILFSDYAHKKRFIWMPKNTHGTYQGDGSIINLPVGAVLIKTFYYDNVLPANTRKIIETRIMIRKSSGWIFAEYVWNDEQTEAYLDMAGSYQDINWIDENNVTRTVNYRVPSEVQCIVCHKEKETIDGQEVTVFTPIGIKPQNLNFNYNYGSTSSNQLTHWIQNGYLENIELPSEANTVVDYNDSSKPIRERVRSYFDINCAHCHKEKGHCDYRPLRLAYSDTGTSDGLTNMGVCVPTQDMQDFDPELDKLITPRRTDKSMLFHRVNTTNEASRMPLHGRTLIHTEGVAIIEEWINSLDECR